MQTPTRLRARFPRLFAVLPTVVALAAVGGVVAYDRLTADCCAPGASCCHPGAPCCAAHNHAG